MRILKRLIVAKWYVKLVAVFAGLLLIPVILMSFLFTTSYLRWGREKQDLLSNVRKYHQYIIDAERRKKKIKISQSKPTRIFDRYNRLIGEFMTEKKEVVPFKDIKKLLVRAILAMEDTEFYVHNGVNIQRTARAVINNLIGRSRGGGSTITQQLAKILFTNRERTIHRKIFEFFGAKELESRYSKNDILLMYLNTVYFGNGAWGVEAASRLYFNKSVRILDVYECALLAGLLSRPESYSPLNDKDAAKRKHIQALSRMVKLGYAKASVLGSGFERFWEELEKKLSSPNVSFWKMRVNKAPYFIEFVRQRLKRYFKEDEIIRGGLRVYTTIDASMQKIARKAVQRGLARVELAKQKDIKEWLFKNRKRISRMIKKATPDEKQQILAIWDQKRASYLNEHSKPIEGALVSIDSSNGYILAMIGGRNYTFDNELNRAINSSRQFGSAMKPIVYTSAIENKVVTAATVINDKRRKYDDHGKVWSPKNYDRQYFGNVSIRKALILSINTVAVET
ncbi:MAG: transglycosylase domain-containing protein, partial [Spirochaetes bacterium]|nr:transglycosylase domain-containing protein [Spirochaetota bacterium]